MRLSYLARIPLVTRILEPASIPDHLSKHPVEVSEYQTEKPRNIHRRGRLACQKVREHLEATPTEMPPPSLADVARRLGYRNQDSLRIKYPELCNQISANYRSSSTWLAIVRAIRCTFAGG